MNFLLAIVLFSVVFMSGFPTDVSEVPENQIPANAKTYVQIGEITKNSPAEKAGLMSMDKILKIDGKDVVNIKDVQDYTKMNPDKNANLVIERQGKTIEKEVFIRKDRQAPRGFEVARVQSLQRDVPFA
jgi:membrane-associated protease RseP (regulator of RpoE activity)